MTYDPVNQEIMQAAYAGAIAGMAVSSQLVDAVQADYTNICAIGFAFAQEFDTIWASGSENLLDVQQVQTICQNAFANRQTTPDTLASYKKPENWAGLCRAIIALVKAGDAYWEGQGVDPLPTPGAGGGFDPVMGVNIGNEAISFGADNNPVNVATVSATIGTKGKAFVAAHVPYVTSGASGSPACDLFIQVDGSTFLLTERIALQNQTDYLEISGVCEDLTPGAHNFTVVIQIRTGSIDGEVPFNGEALNFANITVAAAT